MGRDRVFWPSLLALALLAGVPVCAAPPVPARPADLGQLFEQLDSDEFDRRADALQHLQLLCDDPQQLPRVAEWVQRLLVSPGLSPEVRTQLAPLLKKLNGTSKVTPPQEADWIAAIEALDADEFERRTNAAAKIELWLKHDLAVGPILTRLKQRQAAEVDAPSRESHERLTKLANLARGMWLTAEADRWPLKPLEGADLNRWLDTLTREPTAAPLPLELARQELLDRLANPPDLERVVTALKDRLGQPNLSVDAQMRLDELLQWTKPAMVAEIWNGPRHRTIQHLLIGVPAQVSGAPNPTHFDQIDDRKAHCVSGNSLTLGDWPVGVFFPSPRTPAWSTQFFLFNLPTPRARLAYERYVERPEHERFRDLTRRSTARWLADRTALTPGEIVMLGQLDRAAILEFVPRYLRTVDDASLEVVAALPEALQSRHGLLCVTLATYGDAAVGRALSDPKLQERVDCPGKIWPRLAMIAIGGQTEWPGLDAALAEIVADDRVPDELISQLDIRATAAALLLTRGGLAPSAFGLEPDKLREQDLRDVLQQVAMSDELRFKGTVMQSGQATFTTPIYKFTDDADRRRVQTWWQSREAAKSAQP
ncbi:MAG: hypothetical protein JNM18_17720 [Planctomycetaceae bacterium]|nr:hypothetical protein [Planctomycetaceae bacterium]